MPFYHGTRCGRLASIRWHGIGGFKGPPDWDCERGVYLAAYPQVSIAVLLQHCAARGATSLPYEDLADLCVVVIDADRIDCRKLRHDPHYLRCAASATEASPVRSPDWSKNVWLYQGVIDVTNQPVLGIAQVMGGAFAACQATMNS